MSLDLNNLSVDDLAGLITNGVGNTLEDVLYQDFKAQAEVAARRAAKELAERVSAQITGLKRHDTVGHELQHDLARSHTSWTDRRCARWNSTHCVEFENARPERQEDLHCMTLLRKIAIDLIDGKLPSSAGADLKRERLKLCDQCEYFERLARKCKLCGCFMDLKAHLLEAECPVQKW